MSTILSTRVWLETRVFYFGDTAFSSTILKPINQEKLWPPRIYLEEGKIVLGQTKTAWALTSPFCTASQREKCQRGHQNLRILLFLTNFQQSFFS